jgi:hypothetical protein
MLSNSRVLPPPDSLTNGGTSVSARNGHPTLPNRHAPLASVKSRWDTVSIWLRTATATGKKILPAIAASRNAFLDIRALYDSAGRRKKSTRVPPLLRALRTEARDAQRREACRRRAETTRLRGRRLNLATGGLSYGRVGAPPHVHDRASGRMEHAKCWKDRWLPAQRPAILPE